MPEEGAPLVRLELRDGVGILTLDHPPVNVLSREVLEALETAVGKAEAEPSVRALVLASASPKAFAAGANIREMAPMGPPEAQGHGARGQAATRRLERSPLPVIAAVHGVCLGGGCELALACDVIVASEDASFGQPEVNLGVMPGWGGTQRLPRRIGAAAATYWILSGRSFTASEAMASGLVLRVVPRSELLPSALALAAEFAAKPSTAVAAAKYALHRAADPSLDEGLAFELDLWARLFGTADQKGGMRAFLDKTPFTPEPREPRRARGFPWEPSGATAA